MDWIKKANSEDETSGALLSFGDYQDIFEKAPQRELRPGCVWMTQMMEFFGKDEKGRFKLFQMKHPDAPPVHGQIRTQNAIYQNLLNFQEEGTHDKFLLLVGPNGSAKSSLIKKIMKGAEEYSQKDDGALYTFSWIFPIDHFVKGSLGLVSEHKQKGELKTFAYLEDKDISAIINSELKDHPFLLIPQKYRQEIIDEKLKDNPKLLDTVRKSYLYCGDISKRNRIIYDALLKNYKGDHAEVLKHIRVERFHISKRYSSSAVTIEPQMHVDARIQQITMDKRLANLPPSLQCLNIFSLSGEVIMANRGILEFSDLLKRPLDAFKYLLATIETKSVNLQGVLTELDILFMGTSNEIHMEAFKQHPDYRSFKGRFNFITVPYLLNYLDEEKIYLEQIEALADRTTFDPHAISLLCRYAILTRVRAPMVENYPKNERLGKLVATFNPLEKIEFLATLDIPERFDTEERQILTQGYHEILSEFNLNEDAYEGKFGISPRDMKRLIYKLSLTDDVITFMDVLDFLDRFIMKKGDYEFLNIQPQGDYHDPVQHTKLLREHILTIFDKEVRDSLGMIDARSYEDYIKRYIQNVSAIIKKEKIKNDITGKYEDADNYFIKEFESSIHLKESAENFRSHLISKLGAWYLDNPKKNVDYSVVFPELVKNLQASFREEQNKIIATIANDIVYYESEFLSKEMGVAPMATPLSEENRKRMELVVNNLVTKFGYSPKGTLRSLKYLFKNRY